MGGFDLPGAIPFKVAKKNVAATAKQTSNETRRVVVIDGDAICTLPLKKH